MSKIFDYRENERNYEKAKSYKNKKNFDMEVIDKIKQKIKQEEIDDDHKLNKYQKRLNNMYLKLK